jgi:hypothetical protein
VKMAEDGRDEPAEARAKEEATPVLGERKAHGTPRARGSETGAYRGLGPSGGRSTIAGPPKTSFSGTHAGSDVPLDHVLSLPLTLYVYDGDAHIEEVQALFRGDP